MMRFFADQSVKNLFICHGPCWIYLEVIRWQQHTEKLPASASITLFAEKQAVVQWGCDAMMRMDSIIIWRQRNHQSSSSSSSSIIININHHRHQHHHHHRCHHNHHYHNNQQQYIVAVVVDDEDIVIVVVMMMISCHRASWWCDFRPHRRLAGRRGYQRCKAVTG